MLRRPFAGRVSQLAQGLLEYTVLLAMVAVVVVIVLRLMGGQIEGAFRGVIDTLQGP
ncbi:MAG TPA: Flp family type IVb pilin [Candidatus Dormibacteraeota bacterium]|nr:Flp family type IVb pilin [Candidatus Dormibacteraeota bacterium]